MIATATIAARIKRPTMRMVAAFSDIVHPDAAER
jgi:hypothetical protein